MKRVIFFILFVFRAVQCDESKEASFRIVGGKLAETGEFKGQVSLQNVHQMHLCGGTLINNQSVMTAAHCFKQSDPILYVVGDDTTISPTNISSSRQMREVAVLVLHPEYDESKMRNDLAYIRLEEPFNLTETFQPVARSTKSPKTGQKCTVVGWGYTEYSVDDEVSEDLLKVDVKVMGMDFCNGSNSYMSLMQDGMFCAGDPEGGKDSCQGDSGGLITCEPNLISGVVSFGVGCGLPNYPGVYTDISKPWFQDWIDKMLAIDNFTEYIDNENFDSTSATDPAEDLNQSPTTTILTPIDISNTTTADIPSDNNGATRDYAIQRHYLIFIFLLCIMQFF